MKVGREKYFPGIHNSGWQAAAANLCDYRWKKSKTLVKTNTSLEFISLRSLSLALMSFLRELQWSWVKKTTPVKFTHIQDGYESFSLAVSDLKDTFFGLYIFHTRSQGVTALVSVSDGKIQITILILRRGPCLGLSCVMVVFSTKSPGHLEISVWYCLLACVDSGDVLVHLKIPERRFVSRFLAD